MLFYCQFIWMQIISHVVRCIHDEIIDSYLFLLELKFSHILYYGSAEARAVAAGKSMKFLW